MSAGATGQWQETTVCCDCSKTRAHLSEADPSQAAAQEVVQAGARAVSGVAPVEAVFHDVLRSVARL